MTQTRPDQTAAANASTNANTATATATASNDTNANPTANAMNLTLATKLCAEADLQLPGATRALAALDLALDRIQEAEAHLPLDETPAGCTLLTALPLLEAALVDGHRDYLSLLEGRPWRYSVETEAVRALVNVERLADEHEAF